jgi:hypothetical protein
MTHKTDHSNVMRMYSFLLTLLLLTLGAATAAAQSSDPDSPTQMTSNVVEGEGDGHAAAFYYRFAGGPGDVKIAVDGKTDGYSSPLKVELMDEDGKTLESVYVVAVKTGKREVKKFHVIRQQPVIMKVSMQDDPDIKLLTYKIKLEGDVGFPAGEGTETSASADGTQPTQNSSVSSESPTTTTPTENQPATESADSTASGEQSNTEQSQPSIKQQTKEKAKEKAKTVTKKTVNKALAKIPF